MKADPNGPIPGEPPFPLEGGGGIASSPEGIDFLEKASRAHLIYSLIGLILGLACVIGGIVLFLNGITGTANWVVKLVGIESEISDATPGVILFIVGMFIIWITRFSIKIK